MAMVHVYKFSVGSVLDKPEVLVFDDRYLRMSGGQVIKRAYYKGEKEYRDGHPVYYVHFDRFTNERDIYRGNINIELFKQIGLYQKRKKVKEYVSKL